MVGIVGRVLNFHDDTEPCEIRDVVDPVILAKCTGLRLMKRDTLATQGLVVFTRTKLGDQCNVWNPATMQGTIVCNFLDSTVVGRSFSRVLTLGDPQFPEAWRGNWPVETKPLVTSLIDGWQAILVHDRNGEAQFHGRYGHNFAPYQWAKRHYEQLRASSLQPKGNIWPVGYTPVFEIVSSTMPKIVDGPDKLYLLTIVNNRTGLELDYTTVRKYGALLNLQTPARYVSEDAARKNEERGYCLRWDFEDRPPLRVKVENEHYIHVANVLTTYRGADMVDWLSEGKEDPYFRDSAYPLKFRFWGKKCSTALNNVYVARCEEFNKLWEKFPFKWNPDGVKKGMEYLNDLGKPEYCTTLLTRLKGADYRKTLWVIVKENASSAPSYLESVTGGDINL